MIIAISSLFSGFSQALPETSPATWQSLIRSSKQIPLGSTKDNCYLMESIIYRNNN